MGVSKIDSRVIHTIRFPLICLVVCVHSFSFIEGWDIYNLDLNNLTGADIYTLFCVTFSMTLAHIAVPTFFLISGFLFVTGLEKWNWTVYKGKLNKRLYSLLIPYLIWNTFYIVTKVIPQVGGAFFNKPAGTAIVEWWDTHNGLLMFYHARTFVERISWFGGEGFFSFPILVPMWYVRDLMVLVMLSPLLYWAVQKRIFLIMVLILYIIGAYPYIPGLSPSPLLFFSTGVYLSIKGYEFVGSLRKYRHLAYAIFIALWIILVPLAGYRTAEGNYFYPFFIISGVISIINLISFYVAKEEWLNKEYRTMSFFRKNEDKCFFIFASHIFILPYISAILNKICKIITNDVDVSTVTFAEQYPILLIGCYVIKMLIAILLCIILGNLIQQHTPKFYRLLNGR